MSREEPGPKYRWKCDRAGCAREILSYTELGLHRFKTEHSRDHDLWDKAANRPPWRPTLRDHNVLRLTRADLSFLKTRGVKAPEDFILVEG